LRIKGRLIEGILCGGVHPALTERMLEGKLDGDRLAGAPDVSGGIQQKLDLTEGAQQELLGVSGIESLVAVDDTLIGANNKAGYRVVEGVGTSSLEVDSVIVGVHEIRGVGIASCRVDE